MLLDFLSRNRKTLIARCRSNAAARRAPRATEQELVHGIPLFLDQLIDALRLEQASGSSAGTAPFPAIRDSRSSDIGTSAAQHGSDLLRRGFTVGQVVHGYGDLCQSVTDLAVEQNVTVPADEFRTLNRCLDQAIADAVTEFERRRDEVTSAAWTRATNKRLGFLAHELRNLIGTAILAFATVKRGSVGLSGATGALLDRCLIGLRDLVDRTLVEVRLTAGIPDRRERIVVADLIADVQAGATIEAAVRDLELVVAPIARGLVVEGDRQILAAAVANVLQNAVKFTRPHGRVLLTAHAGPDRILIAVEDECGGLPEGKAEEMFRPFEQLGAERTGLGLGLSSAGAASKRTMARCTCAFAPERAACSPSIFPGRRRHCDDRRTSYGSPDGNPRDSWRTRSTSPAPGREVVGAFMNGAFMNDPR